MVKKSEEKMISQHKSGSGTAALGCAENIALRK
jgi:hypothetical protein